MKTPAERIDAILARCNKHDAAEGYMAFNLFLTKLHNLIKWKDKVTTADVLEALEQSMPVREVAVAKPEPEIKDPGIAFFAKMLAPRAAQEPATAADKDIEV